MVGNLLEGDIIFPLENDDIRFHANRQVLVDIACDSNSGIDIYCFDPAAMVPLNWQHFLQCVFRWAIHCGIRPISMIGDHLPRTGVDLEEDFRDWLMHLEHHEGITALS